MKEKRPKAPRTIEAFTEWLNAVTEPISVRTIAEETGLNSATVLEWIPKAGFEMVGYSAQTFSARTNYLIQQAAKKAIKKTRRKDPTSTKESP